MNESAPLSDLAMNVTEKVTGSTKCADASYVGLEHLVTDQPRISGSAAASTSVSVNTVFRAGDTLFGKLRPYLRKVALADFDGYCSTDILVLRPTQDTSAAFLSHQLRSSEVLHFAAGTAFGTKMPRTAWSMLKELKVFAPPFAEQQRIAEILDTLDDQIRATEKIIAKLRLAKDGLLNTLLTSGVDEEGNLRDPVVRPELFAKTSIGIFPADWSIGRLGSLVSNHGGLIQTGPFGSQLHSYDYIPSGVPVVMPQDINGGRISLASIAQVSEKIAFGLTRHRLNPGDVIFSRRGDLERCAEIASREASWLCGTGCLLVRPPLSRLRAGWLAAIYRHEIGQRYVRATAVGSTMPNLSAGILSGLPLPLPSVAEQDRIVKILKAEDGRVAIELLRLEKLRKIKQGLMSDLLTGRVRVLMEAAS